MVDKSFENRRILCLSEIINYAKILTISVDMKQEKGKEILYLNNQKIDVICTCFLVLFIIDNIITLIYRHPIL